MEIKIVEITDENRSQLLRLAISGYIGKKCRYCQHVYESVDDIIARSVVHAGKNQYACKMCFDAKNASQQSTHADGACPKCGAEGYVILGDGRKYCNVCKTPRR